MWNRRQKQLKAPTNWSQETITNKVFENKFIRCVNTFDSWLKNKIDFRESTILDFGCGDGVMALGMSLRLQPQRVIGIDITPEFNVLNDIAQTQIGLATLPENLEFHLVPSDTRLAERFQADCIFSWSVFEHVSQDRLDAVVLDLRAVLRNGGYFFLQIAPLYYSADGGHLFELSPEPWAHLSVQMNLLHHHVMNARDINVAGQLVGVQGEAQFLKYKEAVWSCFQTLNKVTADDVIDLFKRHGFRVVRQHLTKCTAEPGVALKRIYGKKALKTEQIVVLFQKV